MWVVLLSVFFSFFFFPLASLNNFPFFSCKVPYQVIAYFCECPSVKLRIRFMLLSCVPFGNKTSLPAFAFGNQWNEITLQRWISPSAPSFSHWSVWEFSRPTLSPGSYTLHTWLMMEIKTSIFRYQRRGKRPRLDTNRPPDQLRLSTPVGIFYFTFNPFSERKSETLCSVTVQSEYLECPIWILFCVNNGMNSIIITVRVRILWYEVLTEENDDRFQMFIVLWRTITLLWSTIS